MAITGTENFKFTPFFLEQMLISKSYLDYQMEDQTVILTGNVF